MPRNRSMERNLGLPPCMTRETSASIATSPPSPLLSARRISKTYLSETIRVNVQKNIDTMPNTLASVTGNLLKWKTLCMEYSTLVPMSP